MITELPQDSKTLGGHKQNLVCTRTQEKGAVTPQETEPDLPVSVQESLAEAVLIVRGTGCNISGSCSMLAKVLLKNVAITAITPTIELQGGNTAPPIDRKLN